MPSAPPSSSSGPQACMCHRTPPPRLLCCHVSICGTAATAPNPSSAAAASRWSSSRSPAHQSSSMCSRCVTPCEVPERALTSPHARRSCCGPCQRKAYARRLEGPALSWFTASRPRGALRHARSQQKPLSLRLGERRARVHLGLAHGAVHHARSVRGAPARLRARRAPTTAARQAQLAFCAVRLARVSGCRKRR